MRLRVLLDGNESLPAPSGSRRLLIHADAASPGFPIYSEASFSLKQRGFIQSPGSVTPIQIRVPGGFFVSYEHTGTTASARNIASVRIIGDDAGAERIVPFHLELNGQQALALTEEGAPFISQLVLESTAAVGGDGQVTELFGFAWGINGNHQTFLEQSIDSGQTWSTAFTFAANTTFNLGNGFNSRFGGDFLTRFGFPGGALWRFRTDGPPDATTRLIFKGGYIQ
jgi:hypothetical protein